VEIQKKTTHRVHSVQDLLQVLERFEEADHAALSHVLLLTNLYKLTLLNDSSGRVFPPQSAVVWSGLEQEVCYHLITHSYCTTRCILLLTKYRNIRHPAAAVPRLSRTHNAQ
jgi:hypothetical protein